MIVEIKRDCVIAHSVWFAGTTAEFDDENADAVASAQAAIARGDAVATTPTDAPSDDKSKKPRVK